MKNMQASSFKSKEARKLQWARPRKQKALNETIHLTSNRARHNTCGRLLFSFFSPFLHPLLVLLSCAVARIRSRPVVRIPRNALFVAKPQMMAGERWSDCLACCGSQTATTLRRRSSFPFLSTWPEAGRSSLSFKGFCFCFSAI